MKLITKARWIGTGTPMQGICAECDSLGRLLPVTFDPGQ